MLKRSFLLVVLMGLYAPSLYSQQYSSMDGVWNGGGKEVYMQGNERYCLRADAGSDLTIALDSSRRSCIFVTQGVLIAEECGNDPSISFSNMDGLYNIVVGPDRKRNNLSYTVSADYDGEFDRCGDYYMSGYLGMSADGLNLAMALSGFLSALMFVGAITYIILSLGNF